MCFDRAEFPAKIGAGTGLSFPPGYHTELAQLAAFDTNKKRCSVIHLKEYSDKTKLLRKGNQPVFFNQISSPFIYVQQSRPIDPCIYSHSSTYLFRIFCSDCRESMPTMTTSLPRHDDRVIRDLCSCPAPCPVQEQFQLLQTMLNERGLPPTRDRREQPRSGDDNDITVVLLAELEEAVNIFFEGNQNFRVKTPSFWEEKNVSTDLFSGQAKPPTQYYTCLGKKRKLRTCSSKIVQGTQSTCRIVLGYCSSHSLTSSVLSLASTDESLQSILTCVRSGAHLEEAR